MYCIIHRENIVQISTAINLPQPVQQRPEREQQDLRREQSRELNQPPTRVTEPTSNDNNLRRIDIAERVRESNFQRNEVRQDLPFRSQQALQTFQQNRPTIEQQLGVEIVGVDIFA